jgi:alpha-beta hydrolase superfamily lysophospholipase
MKNFLLIIIASTLLFSCSKDEELVYEFYHSHTVVKTYTKVELQQLIQSSDLLPNELASFVFYDVRAIKIEYKTVDVNGEPIIASGGLLMPVALLPLPVLSYQHATILEQSEAPSAFQSVLIDLVAIFSSMGYQIPMPDYLGYGTTSHIDHPYEHKNSLATATRDMLRASYEFFDSQLNTVYNQNLFLTGYSEGGFATMATLKLLQEEHQNEFNIKAATVGAGAYNKTAFANYIINSNENQQYINYFLWVLDVYNKLYPQLNRPYSHYFNEPYAANIAQNGVFAAGIEQNPSLLFTQTFREAMQNGTDTDMLEVLAANDCFDWKPNFPLRLYHGTSDNFVQFLNSQTAFAAMQAQGASQVELISIQGGDHETSLPFYLLGTFGFFNEMSVGKNQLPNALNPEGLKVSKE